MNYQIISQRLPDTSVIEQVLINRGIQPSEIRHYLNTTKKDILDPSKITFYDTETGEHLPCVPGTEVHYAQNSEFDCYDVEIGVITEDEELRDNWYKRYKVFYDQTTWLY